VGQEALAETLYQDGRALMAEGRYEQACPKLAESHEVDPAGGTVLLLALCYEQVGKTASAWVKFNEALAIARRDGRQDRVDRAKRHLRKLEPALSRITIEVQPESADTEGFVVLLDGAQVPRLAWTRGLPADPGPHDVEARAPGHRTWSRTIVLGNTAARETVSVPPLAPVPEPSPAPVEPSPAPSANLHATASPANDTGTSSAGPSATLGYLVGGAGIVTLSVGGYFGIRALDRHADARDRCPDSTCTDHTGVQLNEDARKDATVANVLTGAGVVLVGVGTYLWLSAPDADGTGTALVVRPRAAASGLSVAAETRW